MNRSVSFTKTSFCILMLLSCNRGFGAEVAPNRILSNLHMALRLGSDVTHFQPHVNIELPLKKKHTFVLHQAVINGSTTQVEAILGAPDLDPNAQDGWGRTPLLYALEGTRLVRGKLLRSTAVNADKAKYDRIARMLLAQGATSDLVRQYVERESDFSDTDKEYILQRLDKLVADQPLMNS